MDKVNKIEVFYHDKKVGVMALHQNMLVAFEYDDNWLKEGFSISPFSLRCKRNRY